MIKSALKIGAYLMVFMPTSCVKTNVAPVDFGVSTNKTAYKAGDTVQFNFSGNPDIITFYSGDAGNDYQLRERNVLSGKTTLQFSSYKQNGAQLGSLQLLISTDFKGAYSKNGLSLATWTDITSQAALSDGSDNVPSGSVDISDYVTPFKQTYICFRKLDANSSILRPNQWTIRSFSVDVTLADSSVLNVTNLKDAGWLAVDSLNSAFKWVINPTSLVAAGGNVNTAANEDWVITKALTPLNIKPDAGIAVKGIDSRSSNYRYVFSKPGTYGVVFVASNNTIYDRKTIVKSLTITVI